METIYIDDYIEMRGRPGMWEARIPKASQHDYRRGLDFVYGFGISLGEAVRQAKYAYKRYHEKQG